MRNDSVKKPPFNIRGEITHGIFEANDLLEMAEYLDLFATYIGSSKDGQAILEMEKLLSAYQDNLSMLDAELPYLIFEKELTIAQYLFNVWPTSGNFDERLDDILEIVEKIQNMLIPPQGERLGEREIRYWMDHLESRFKYCTKLFPRDKLRISLVDNSIVNQNSIYTGKEVGENIIHHTIFLTHQVPGMDFPQEHTFLHELGHVLHTAVTRQQAQPPASFRQIQKKMFTKSLDWPPKRIAEIFADCFGYVAAIDTKLEKENPLDKMHPDDKIFLAKYFESIFEGI